MGWPRRIGSWLVALGLLVAALAIEARHDDDYDKQYAPVAASGSLGEPVDAGTFSLRVDGVVAARTIVPADEAKVTRPKRTSGIFLVVHAAERAKRRAQMLPTAYIRARNGGEYYQTDKLGTINNQTLDTIAAQPDYWVRGSYVFDLPRSALRGAELEVSSRDPREVSVPSVRFPAWGFELSPQANVDLRIDAGKARSLVANAKAKALIGQRPG